MPSKGRRKQNQGFKKFKLNLKINDKRKAKYTAQFLEWKTHLSNISKSRLQAHRNICIRKKEIKISESDTDHTIDSDIENASFLSKGEGITTTHNESQDSVSGSGNISIADLEVIFGKANPNIEIEYLDVPSPSNIPSRRKKTGSLNDEDASENAFDVLLSHAQKKETESVPGSPNIINVQLTNIRKSRIRKITNFLDIVSKEEEKKIEDAIAKFFFGCNIPISVIDSDHFKNLIKVLRTGYLDKPLPFMH